MTFEGLQVLLQTLAERLTETTDRGLQQPIKDRMIVAERTLEAVRGGTYTEGICADCGEDIPPRRLQLVPETMHCTACASAADT